MTDYAFPILRGLNRSALLLCLLFAATAAQAAKPPQWLLGKWELNNEMTQAVQVEKKQSSSGGFGGMSTTVAIGGVAVPLPGSTSSSPATSGSPRDPSVLRCKDLEISTEGDNLRFVFAGVGEEVMKPGDNQGRVTRWNRSKLTSNYQTTSRKVYRTYKLQKDGTLLVTVKIKPKQAASIVQKRVFQRPAG
jgi:hypothetical protein